MSEQTSVIKLTAKEERFCQEFVLDFNGTQAAIRSKYSQKTARQIASFLLTKVDIKTRIAQILEANEMAEGEIKKRFSDIARTDMADYLVKRKVPYTPQIKVGLADVIRDRQDYIRREELFCERMGYTGEALDNFQEQLDGVRAQIIRMEIELEENPNAYRIVDGETEMVEVAELDLLKLAADKNRGAIKSIKSTKDGLQVEGYSADSALTTLAKFKGMLVEKSEVDLNGQLDTVVKIGYGDAKPG